MSLTAEELGAKLLAEVEECQLDQVLHAVQSLYQHQQYHDDSFKVITTSASSSEGQTVTTNAQSYPHLGIPALDALLASSLPSTTSHHARQRHEHQNESAVIELTQTTPGGGALPLLYAAIAAAVLPSSSFQQPTSTSDPDLITETKTVQEGKAGVAIVLDAEGTFDVSHLAHTMLSRLSPMHQPSTTTDTPSPDYIEPHLPTIEQALTHVHIFRPTSLAQLASTVAHLPTYLHSLQAASSAGHASYDRPLTLIALDSASTFHWADRNAQAQAQAQTDVQTPTQSQAMEQTAWTDLVHALRTMQTTFPRATLLATAWPLLPVANAPTARAAFVAHLPPAWKSLVSTRLVVQRDPVRKFPAGMSLAQCVREERERRSKVVQEGRFSVWRVGEQGVRRAMFSVDESGVHF